MTRCLAVLPDNQMGAVVPPDRLEEGWDRCERSAGHDGPHTVRIRLAWSDLAHVNYLKGSAQ